MNWIYVLILIPIIVVGVMFAFYVAPKTPEYVPKTTTTTTKTTTKATIKTTSTSTTTTTIEIKPSPCNLFKAVCKTQCSPTDVRSDASCDDSNLVCCKSTIVTTTTSTTTFSPGYIPT